MDNHLSLRNKLDNLVKDGRSGIVALCGDAGAESGLDYIAYFHSLDIVYVVRSEFGREYFDADANSFVTKTLREFSARQDHIPLAELGVGESQFLESALSELLWDMTHDDGDVPDDFDEPATLARAGLPDPAPVTADQGYWAFTLFGLGGLESDILRFRELLLAKSPFSAAGNGFSLGSYLDETDRKVYVLNRQCDDIITDDETGEQYPVYFFEPVLANCDWRTLYARARTMIYLNAGNK